MLVTRRRGSIRNGRNKSPLKSETNQEKYKGSLVSQDYLNEMDDDVQSKSQRIDVDGSQHGEARAEITQRSHGKDKPVEDCDMAQCQDITDSKQLSKVQERPTQFEKTRERAGQSSRSRNTKGLGVKSSRTLKRQLSSSGTKNTQGQSVSPTESPKFRTNGSKLPRCNPSAAVELGDMVQEHGSWDSRRDNRADKGISNDVDGVAQRSTEERLEADFSSNTDQLQNRAPRLGPSGVGSHSQPMVEVHHGYSSAVLGGSGEIEQISKAISGAPLRRIRLGNSGEEDCRLQGDGFSSHGEPSVLEADPSSSTRAEVRPSHLLQGGDSRHPSLHDDMETGMDYVQRPVEESGLEHGRCSYDES